MSQFTVEDCVDFLRYMEVAVLGLMAFTFLTDNGPGRGRLAHDLHMLWGYPTWIVPVAGSVQVRAPSGLQSCAPRTRGERSAVLTQAAWQALICWANFAGAGRRYVAQKLLAFLMGGSAAPAHRHLSLRRGRPCRAHPKRPWHGGQGASTHTCVSRARSAIRPARSSSSPSPWPSRRSGTRSLSRPCCSCTVLPRRWASQALRAPARGSVALAAARSPRGGAWAQHRTQRRRALGTRRRRKSRPQGRVVSH
jgi:hypothetical protein